MSHISNTDHKLNLSAFHAIEKNFSSTNYVYRARFNAMQYSAPVDGLKVIIWGQALNSQLLARLGLLSEPQANSLFQQGKLCAFVNTKNEYYQLIKPKTH